MTAEEPRPSLTRIRDDINWRIGTDADVAWIKDGTVHTHEDLTTGSSAGATITGAIPPIFDTYAVVALVKGWDEEEQRRHDRAFVALLREHSAHQPWWLGYLDTGADDIIFPDAPMVTLYTGWSYVLVEAGPEQATTWRRSDAGTFWKGALPNLMFPTDHSWLVSTLWDDAWTCMGGSAALIAGVLRDPVLRPNVRPLGL